VFAVAKIVIYLGIKSKSQKKGIQCGALLIYDSI
jgi:hypothetical protein